eukprot:CAMPEP_0170846992 /NCGR_PEP_ID=MMETSP0734-20130129/8488_1 /TAXON_ID=186038 /ORGANISM="Fragilariopsis kerguelensis, Strain L26-C5" /LENGTH=427 /DNA_ID=CAMNT_0011216067 /DNA_START=76 /DNA_END=1359 /DNA_ORIENTATION=+
MIDPSSKARSNSSPWTGVRGQSRLRPAGLVAGLRLIDEKEEPSFSIVRNLPSDNDSEPATQTEPPSASKLQLLCNEAKCLSTGLFPGKMFNCYGQGPNTLFPFLCADEWIGIEITSLDGVVATPEYPNMKYYTCCPPVEGADEDKLLTSSQQELQRHCLDPQLQPQPQSLDVDSDSEMDTDTDISSICAKKYPSTYQYGREMTQISGIPDAYMCCNNDDFDDDDGDLSIATGPGIVTTPTNEVDDPVQLCYPNIWCSSQSCKVTNAFFNLQRMNCANDVYRYPELIEITGNTGMYQCCSVEEELLAMARRKRRLSSTSTTNTNSTTTSTTTPAKLNNGSFLMDTAAFNATIYTQFIIALIASLLSFTLIVAISVSLYKMKKKPTHKNQRNNNYGRSRTSAPDYSSYNLYLVFLSDIIPSSITDISSV